MLNLSVCVEMFWADQPIEEKIRRIGQLGYKNFEFWGWADKDMKAIRQAADSSEMKVAACCMEPNFCLVDPTGQKALLDRMQENIRVANQLGTSVMILTTGNVVPDESFAVTRRRVVQALKALAKPAEDARLTLVVEPLNTLVDHPGYWLTKMADATDIIEEVDSANVRLLMDIYHQQITEGNIIANLRRHIDLIGHFHCAGVPGRHELAGGELDYRSIFNAINETHYHGCVGLEFSPAGDETTALRQAQDLVGDSCLCD